MTATRRPTVSVVVPCYRYGRFLERCVASLLDQEGVDVRVLIIDDCSPDDSAEIARAIAAREPRVECRVHEVNRGHIATYNEGLLEWADGDYVMLISADDVLTPNSLTRSVEVLEADPAVGFVYGHAIFWDDREPLPAPRAQLKGVRRWTGAEWLKIMCRLGHCVVPGPTVLVRTELQRKAGGYSADLPHTADVEMWLRFAAHADVAFVQGVDQAYYRIHGAQMTVERVPLIDLQQRKGAYDSFFEDYGERMPEVAALRRRADRAMAKEALWRACRAYERRGMATVPVEELVAFARAAYDDADRLPEAYGLRWRRRVGPRVSPYLQPLILSAVHRKVRRELWWRRWARQGV
jgi:Glycosyl transferase family 2